MLSIVLRVTAIAICLALAPTWARADATNSYLECNAQATGIAVADWCFHLFVRSTPNRDGLSVMVAHFNKQAETAQLTFSNGTKLLKSCTGLDVYKCTFTWPRAQMQSLSDYTIVATLSNGVKVPSYGKLKRP